MSTAGLNPASRRLLIIGYGNPACGDDALGPSFVERLEVQSPSCIAFECNYQITVDDAALLAEAEQALLVDASVSGEEPYSLTQIEPAADFDPSLLTHRLEASQLLALCRRVYGCAPRCNLLAIRGYNFEQFTEGLSPQAERNLNAAWEYFLEWKSENVLEKEVRREG